MLEVKWKVQQVQTLHKRTRVSILVMLEVKWKEEELKAWFDKGYRFNPCYVGSKMESQD